MLEALKDSSTGGAGGKRYGPLLSHSWTRDVLLEDEIEQRVDGAVGSSAHRGLWGLRLPWDSRLGTPVVSQPSACSSAACGAWGSAMCPKLPSLPHCCHRSSALQSPRLLCAGEGNQSPGAPQASSPAGKGCSLRRTNTRTQLCERERCDF